MTEELNKMNKLRQHAEIVHRIAEVLESFPTSRQFGLMGSACAQLGQYEFAAMFFQAAHKAKSLETKE